MSNFLAVKTNFKNTFRFLRNFYLLFNFQFLSPPYWCNFKSYIFFYPKPKDFVRGPTDFVQGPKDFVQNPEILSRTQRFCPKPEDFVQNPKILSKDPKIWILSQTQRFCPKPEDFVQGPEDLPSLPP